MIVSKELWVEYKSFKQFKKILEEGGKAELKISTTPDSGMDYMETLNITYEIDREVTIKESDFEKHLQEWDLNTPSIRVTDYLKEKLFGGGENE